MHYYLKSVIIKKEMLLQNKDCAYIDGSHLDMWAAVTTQHVNVQENYRR